MRAVIAIANPTIVVLNASPIPAAMPLRSAVDIAPLADIAKDSHQPGHRAEQPE